VTENSVNVARESMNHRLR